MSVDRPIFTAVILFASLLVAFFLAFPAYNDFVLLQKSLAEKTAEYNAQYDYYSSAAKLYGSLQENKVQIEKIDNALPQGQDLGRLAYYFQKTTAEDGLALKNLLLSKNPSSTAKKQYSKDSKMSDTVFSLTLSGEYSSLGRFLTSLEKSSRMFEVVNISFGSPASDISSVLASMSKNQPGQENQFKAGKIYTFSLQVLCHSY